MCDPYIVLVHATVFVFDEANVWRPIIHNRKVNRPIRNIDESFELLGSPKRWFRRLVAAY